MRRGRAIRGARVLECDAELVRLQAGGNIRMRLRVDVRIHAQRHRRLLAHFAPATAFRRSSSGIDSTLKHFTPAASASRISSACLADAGKHGVLRFAAGGQHARQFAARHDVEAGAEAREHVQHREIAIGLDGDVHGRATAGASAGVRVPRLGERGARIDVQRRAELFGERDGGHAFGVQHAVDVVKCGSSHAKVLLSGGDGGSRQRSRSSRMQQKRAARRVRFPAPARAACPRYPVRYPSSVAVPAPDFTSSGDGVCVRSIGLAGSGGTVGK